jgi:hypothetical protein
MKVHQLSGPPSPELADALAQFEEPFTYPLGAGRFFRISHGADYTLFFRAQGRASCFIAENDGRVVGALGTAIRKLWLPDGVEREVAYFGDLKIARDLRGGVVLMRLARAAEVWLRPKVQAGFGVVMGGTSLTPAAYTGRAGIPDFKELGRLTIFRISLPDRSDEQRWGERPREPLHLDDEEMIATPEAGLECYRRLSTGRCASPVSSAVERSEITPVWLMTPDGSACGLLEDTRKAKRLISDDGSEMLSAHLSCFAYRAVAAASRLIGVALNRSLRSGFPAVFVSVPETDAPTLQAALSHFTVHPAPATVYGTGLEPGYWNVNTAEI